MKSLPEQMGVYAAYHRHPVNKAIHLVFVPMIVWSLMVALDWLPIPLGLDPPVTAAMVVTAALLIWYLRLDVALGIAAVVVFTVLLVSAIQLNAAIGRSLALQISAIAFVVGFGFQFIGHGVWEKRRPALADNLFQVLVAPIFIITEVAFSMGLRRDLQEAVEDEAIKHAV